jgi:hypothetical protein
MAAGTWIYERGTTSGGGGPVVAPDAPPVVITDNQAIVDADGQYEVTVGWKPGAGAPTTGVAVFLEDPDLSALAEAPMDGSIALDGTSQLSGKWQPVRETDSFTSPAILKVPAKAADRNVRVYLQAYGQVKNATLIRANKPGATPNVMIFIPAEAGEYISGQEFAWNVTNPSVVIVNDFENPAGPKFHLTFGFTEPSDAIPLPPGLNPFAGVQIVYEYDDGRRAQALFCQANKPSTWISNDYDAAAIHFKVWFCAADDGGNVNTIVKGVTPEVDVTIVYPPAGQASAPDITGLALTNSRFETEPDGTMWALADLHWTVPTSPRYAGVTFYRVDVQPPRQMAIAPAPQTAVTLYVNDWPKTAQAWTIAGIAHDFNGKPSADPTQALPARVPVVTWQMGPPGPGGTGQEFTGLGGAAGASVTFEQQLNSDGIIMMRTKITGWTNPPDNSFGGMSIGRIVSGGAVNTAVYWDAAKGATSFTSDWEPAPAALSWDFYFVSRDMQGHRNSILVGSTPSVLNVAFAPMAGSVLASRYPNSWFDTSEFQWPAGSDGVTSSGPISALQIVAGKIFVGSILRVGGGSGTDAASFKGQQNGQIAVYNASNVLRGWIGEQDSTGTPDNTAPHSIYGGWFAELYVGGTGPPSAPIYANNNGVVIVGGFDVQGSQYPYISIRDNTGIEVGRIGARIGYNQSGIGSGDPAYTIQGAWFREFAYGGQSYSDWRMMARMDASAQNGATVTMRNINNFTINYMQNYPSASNPTNAANTLTFGYDAFEVVTPGGDTRYWKFPGLSLFRTGTTHGALFINRGVILRATDGANRAALVTFNDDTFGSNTPDSWYGALTLANTQGTTVVTMTGGNYTSGILSGVLKLSDGSGTNVFSVNESRNVVVQNNLSCGSLTISGALTTNGLNAGSGAITGGSLNVGSGGVTGGTISGTSLVLGSGSINCGGIVGTSLGLGTGAVTCGTVNASSSISTVDPAGTSGGKGNLSCTTLRQTNDSGTTFICAQNAIWSGQGVQTNSAVYAGSFGINGVAVGASGSFTTADGKTVTVNGGIITKIQ